MRLNRENRNHEIIRKPGIAEKCQVFWKFFAQAAHQRDRAQRQHQKRDEQIDRLNGVQFQTRTVPAVRRNTARAIARRPKEN